MVHAPSPARGSVAAFAPATFCAARFFSLVELSRAIRFRRDCRELSSAVFGESRVIFLEVLEQVKTGHAVVDARTHRLASADGLVRVGEADTNFLQVSEEDAIVVIGGRLLDAGVGVRRNTDDDPHQCAEKG
jgi:hypothetical protein